MLSKRWIIDAGFGFKADESLAGCEGQKQCVVTDTQHWEKLNLCPFFLGDKTRQ